MKLIRIFNQPSWKLASDKVVLYLTQCGGHLGPATFRLGGRTVQPYDIAPWATEKSTASLEPLLRALRGDFFCLPFGGNAKKIGKDRFPAHGETAQADWVLKESRSPLSATWSLRMKIRQGTVLKKIWLVPGQTTIYQRHEIHGARGLMNPGHHAILKFPDQEGSGVISTSPFEFGQVYPGHLENPAKGGYSALKRGAKFRRLEKVPLREGGMTDLSRYPARRGFEDLVMMVSRIQSPFAWTAVTFPEERYVWFALKDPKVLRQTIFWISNGGRHYAPWNGRHVSALGLEEVTSHFHEGIAESAAPNAFSKRGIPTTLRLSPRQPTYINYIMAMAEIPRGFDRVKTIRGVKGGVVLQSASGKKITTPVDWRFLSELRDPS